MPVPDGVVLTPAFMARFAAGFGPGAPARSRLDLAAARQRPARGPQLRQRRRRRQPQLCRRVRVGDRRRSRRVWKRRSPASRPRSRRRGLSSYGCTPSAPAACWCSAWSTPNTPACCSRAIRRPAASPWSRWCEGTAENLVSGKVRPQTFRFGRVTKKPFGNDSAPIDLWPLLALGDAAEASVRRPAGHRMGLSARGASTSCRAATSRGRWRAMPTRPRCRTTSRVSIDMAKDAAPRMRSSSPRTSCRKCCRGRPPLSLSLMEALWASGGSVDLAARELGLSYRVEDGASYLATILGRLYVDKREEQVARAGRRPAGGAPPAAHGRPHRARLPRPLPAAVPRARRGC